MSLKISGKFKQFKSVKLGISNPPVDMTKIYWETPAGYIGTFIVETENSFTISINDPIGNFDHFDLIGTLPNGIYFNSWSGILSGSASDILETTNYPITINAYDQDGYMITRNFIFTVTPNAQVVWLTPEGDLGTIGAGVESQIFVQAEYK